MKTKDFIKKINELGFKTNIVENDIYVETGYYNFEIARISMLRPYDMDISYESYYGIDDGDKNQLFKLIVEYTSTPINERYEHKQYYLKHKHYNDDGEDYVNLVTNNVYSKLILSSKNQIGDGVTKYQTKFTDNEINNLVCRFGINLDELDKIDVEEKEYTEGNKLNI